MVTETDLQKHLGIVKDFYLTGRGELFHDFLLNLKGISYSKNALASGASTYILFSSEMNFELLRRFNYHKTIYFLDVASAFVLAAGRVQVQEEIFQRIQISVKPPPGIFISLNYVYREHDLLLHHYVYFRYRY